jgi:TPR repeat protein
MKTNQLLFTVLLLVTATVFQLLAQQNEADRKVLAEIRAGADKGDAEAWYELGRAFFSGALGVAKDEAEAVKWFRKAAEQNLADAQYILGVCYDSGEGVAKDEIEAYKWWLLAAGHGNDDTKYNMTIVENKMTREQIAEGQRLARDFKPRKVSSEGSDARLPP